MSELRHDPLSGRDVIIAAGRTSRPVTFVASPGLDVDSPPPDCPFCPGHESETPPEVARTGTGEPGTPGWRVRVFPNLYPIVETHEVIALSPDHRRSFGQLSDVGAVEVFTVMRDRVRTHLAAGHEYAVAIVNHLRPAGTSIEHPHAQVFALDVVPDAVTDAIERVGNADRDLVLDDAATEELAIACDPAMVWCPHTSTSPYLVRIAHEGAGPSFDGATDDVIASVALAMRDTLARLDAAIGDPPYNVVVHTAPPGTAPFHWYVEIVPRVSVVAGFELATGILVNTVPPERAAHDLRRSSR